MGRRQLMVLQVLNHPVGDEFMAHRGQMHTIHDGRRPTGGNLVETQVRDAFCVQKILNLTHDRVTSLRIVRQKLPGQHEDNQPESLFLSQALHRAKVFLKDRPVHRLEAASRPSGPVSLGSRIVACAKGREGPRAPLQIGEEV
jgi:hypothetical protein